MKKNLSFSNFQLLKGFFLLLLVVFVQTSSNAQNFNLQINDYQFQDLSDNKNILFADNKTEIINLGFSFSFNDQHFDKVFVSKSGWLSFDRNTNLKTLSFENYAHSFITPLLVFDQTGKSLLDFDVSFKGIFIGKDEGVVIQWKNKDIAFQVVLMENGIIDFEYNSLSSLENIIAINQLSAFGVLSTKEYIGSFPFNLSDKRGKKLSYNDIAKTNTSGVVSFNNSTKGVVSLFSEDFETANSLTLVSDARNYWYRSDFTTANSPDYCLHVSRKGDAYDFRGTQSRVSHAYFDVDLTAGGSNYTLSFWYKSGNSSANRDLKVYVAPTSVTPAAASDVSGADALIGTYNNQSAWTQVTYDLSAYEGSTKRIIFTWINDDSGTNPESNPAAIDDIEVTYDDGGAACPAVAVPYSESFESISTANTLPTCMAATNLGSQVYTYIAPTSYNRAARTGTDFAAFEYGSDDWIFTEGLDLTAGVTYEFSFWYVTDGNSGWTTLEASFGSAQNSGAMTTAITGASVSSPTNTTYTQMTGTFTPSSDGTYYCGIHCVSNSTPWYLSIDDINVSVPTNMSYVSSTTTQASTASVSPGSINQQIICIQIETSGSANPLDVTSFTVNASGSTDISDINSVNSAKIYYTGTSSTFATTTLFGQNTPTIANYNITGTQELAEGTNYFWLTYDIKAGATQGDYVDAQCTSLNVGGARTPVETNPVGNRQIPVFGLFDGTFESGTAFISNGMTSVDDDTNYWIVGTATDNGGANSAYITNDGSSNTYTNSVIQVSHFYFDYDFAAGATSINLDFDWKCDGEGSYDNMRVFLVPTSTTPVAGTSLVAGQLNTTDYSEQLTWGTENISIDVVNAGTTKRIVFSWKNDGSLGANPPIAIDNITFSEVVPSACSGTPTAGTISSDISDFCGVGEPTLTVSGYSINTGISFQWQSSPDGATWTDIAGATSSSLTDNITTTTYYQLIVTCDNSGISSTTNSVMVENTSANITSTGVTYSGVCNTTATLTATHDGGAGVDVYWYDQPTGGTTLATGSPYSPLITESTTYYVSAGDGGTSGNVGKTSSDLSDGYYGSTGTGIVFDAISDFTLVSVKAYVQTAGSDVIIQMVNSSGTELASKTFTNCPAGLQTFNLDFSVTVGTDYRLVSNNGTYMARDFSGATWPYTFAGVCSLTGGWLGSSSTTYYFFYDWVVSSGCESARVPIDVTVTSGISAPSCSANPYPLDAAVAIDPDDDLSWDASADPCQQATSYLLYFGTDNPPTNIINGLDIGDVLTYDPGTLTVPETYYWKVVPTNSAGDASGCSVWSFTTDYTYCESSATSTSDMDITNVTFGTINNNSTYNSLNGSQGTATGTAGMYSDWRGTTVPVPVFSQGQTYPFSVTIDDGGSSYSHRVDVYIDFNHDGDLLDAGEQIPVFAYANPTTPNTTNVNITIPAGAVTGNTLMRVIVVESSSSSACGTYTWGETEDYIIQIGVPGQNTITAGAGVEPATFATTIDNQAAAVLNFDFTVNDDGDTPDYDTDKTLITQITINQGTGNTIADWSSVIAGAVLEASDGTIQDADITINPTSIVFSNVDNSGGGANLGEIDDNASKTYTLKVWLSCPLSDITEGDNFVFEVDYAGILVEATGSSGFAIGENENSGATNNVIQTSATHIEILEQPTNTEVNMIMFPHVKIAAVDDCGVVDADFSGTVTVSSTGTMTGDPITANFVNGVADLEILHTVTGFGLTLGVSSTLGNLTSDPFNIVNKDCQITTTPAHTNGELFVCEGAIIDFEGDYTGSGTVDSWTWRMGDGHEETTQDVSNYPYDDASGYYVELTVQYSGSVEGTCATAVHIMVSPGPSINNVSSDIESCDGFTYDLTASGTAGSAVEVTGYSGTGAVALSLADQTYLPDIETDAEVYQSSLEYTQFDPASTLTSGDFVTVYANLEHSFWGDLEIWLECPNGQTAHLTDGQTNGWNGSGASGTFLGEPVDEDVLGTSGTGMEYRWTMVNPTLGASMDDISFISPFPYEESYTDNAGTEVVNHDYYPEGSYYPLDDFADLVGCPLNGVWTIYVKDFLGVDDGYIFEWGLELDESLMPGQWEYTADIVSYDWTGTGVTESHPTGAETSVTPPAYGANIYTLTITDEYGCSTDQDVTVTLLQCDGVWTGDVSTDWFTDANWGRGFVPDGVCSGGYGRNVTIPDVSAASGNFPVITGFANCDDFTVDAGANVKIAAGGALTVCGTMTNNGGNTGVVLLSDATGDGSLIHSNTGVVGTVEKFIPGTRYHYIGSPVIGATSTGIGVSTTQFYQWDATMEWFGTDLNNDGTTTPYDDDYAPWGTTYSGGLDIGKGYAYYHETQTLQFVGEINVGDYNLSLDRTTTMTTGDVLDQGWNLLSNPYASAINWDIIGAALPNNTDLEGAIYLFDDDDGSGLQTNYSYYVPSDPGTGITGIGTANATAYIPVGQGFFVRTTSNGETFDLTASSRVHNSQAFYKKNNLSNILRLNISNQDYSDELIVRLLESATFDYDAKYDARKLIPSNPAIPQMFTMSNSGDRMSINSLPLYTDSSVVPVCVVGLPGSLTITSSEINLEGGRNVYLFDKQENKILLIDDEFSYSFIFEGGIDYNRFELLFTANLSPIVNINIDDISTLEDYQFDFTLNPLTFVDPDSDYLVYSASLIDGQELPSWLNFDSDNIVFWGYPENSNVGTYYIKVTATDEYGADISEVFVIEVINTNDIPFLNIPIPDYTTYVNEPISIKLPANTFIDVDEGDRLAYSATFNNGLLPTWLHFDENNLIFSGTPINSTDKDYEIMLTATDIFGEQANDIFLISVKATTGLNVDSDDISVSPNPSNGLFSLSTNNIVYNTYNVFIYDATGKLVHSSNANSTNYEIDLTGMASGVYTIKVVFNDNTFIKKIIIE